MTADEPTATACSSLFFSMTSLSFKTLLLGLAMSVLVAPAQAQDTTPPAAPTGLSAMAGDSQAGLNWDDNTEGDLAGYNVYRSTSSIPNDLTGATKVNGSLAGSSDYNDTGLTNGTTYYYRVTAVDGSSNESSPSSEVTATPTADTTPPAAPSNLAASAGDAQVDLNWDANTEPDLAGYDLYRSTSTIPNDLTGASLVNAAPLSAGATSYTDDGSGNLSAPSNGTQYYYRLVALDVNGNQSSPSNEDSATPADVTSPSAPTGLSGTAGDSQVGLDWDDNAEDDLAGYNVYRSTSSIPNDLTGATKVNGSLVGSSQYTDTGVTNGTTYYYRVTAVDGSSNESSPSSEVTATPTADTTPPAAPSNLAASAGDAQVGLSWDANTEPDLAGYDLYRSTSTIPNDLTGASLVNTAPLSAGATSYTDDGSGNLSAPSNGTQYYYRLVALDVNGNQSSPSNEDSATPADATPPSAPTGFAASAGDTQVGLSWDANGESDLAGYNLYRSTSSPVDVITGNKVNGSLLTGTSHTDTGLSNGTTYYYVLTAVDGTGNESDASSEASATPQSSDSTPPSAPTGLAASAGDGAVDLSWDSNEESDLNGYNVYRSTSSIPNDLSGASKVNGSLVQDLAYTDNTVANGTQYYYRITAVDNSSNESSPSNEDSATPTDTPPSAPTGLAATGGDTQVSLSWDSNSESDMDAYEVHRSTSSGFTPDGTSLVTSVSHTGGGESYTDTGLSNGTTYYYKIIAVDGASQPSSASSEASATPSSDTTPPDTPTRLVLADQQFGSPSGDGEVHAGWVSSVASDLAGYNLYRHTSSFSNTGTATKVNGSVIPPKQTTYVDGGVTNGSTYYYRVTAVDVNGNESSLSNEVIAGPASIADSPSGAPATPSSVGLRTGDGKVAVTLSAANSESDLRGYNLYRSTSCPATTGDTKVNGSTPISRGTLTYVDDGVANGQTYCYGITAVDFAGNESSLQTNDSYNNSLQATPGAAKGGVSADFIEWLPGQSSWTSSQTGSGTFVQDSKLHYVYNGADGTNRPFDVIGYAGNEIGISGMYDLNFNDPGAKNVQGGPGDAPALSPLAGLTNGTNTGSSTTALDTQFSPTLTLKFKVYDDSDPNNDGLSNDEIAYMIVTGSVSGASYQDNASAPDILTLTVSPADFADTPQGGVVFPGEGGLYISFFSQAFQGASTVPNAIFANNVYASDITASADLSQLSSMAGIKVNGTDGNPVSLKFYFNKSQADASWGTSSVGDLAGARETGTGTGTFEAIPLTTSTDNSNFDLDFDGATETTYVVDLSNDQWSTRFVTAGSSGAIPVELTSFEGMATAEGVSLQWKTVSETNNAGFDIERKPPGGTFEKVGHVEGHGTATTAHTYRFDDHSVSFEAATAIYRLKQIDYDGSFEYSAEVEVELNRPRQFSLYSAYPNPFTDRATIRYELPRTSDVQISIYNVLGQQVTTLVNERQAAGRKEVTFDAAGLSSGLYLIRMQARDFTATRRIMLTR